MKTKWLFTVASALLLLTSCSSNNHYFESTPTNTPNGELFTRSASIDYSEYLDVSSGDISQWTEDDYWAASLAIERFEIIFSKEESRYNYLVPSANAINISDTLYHCIASMILRTNEMFALTSRSTVTRMKTRSGESSSPLPDCVPAAVANMGKDAPSYSTALAKCDEMFPGWRTSGGVPTTSIESFIEVYTPVSEYNNLSYWAQYATHDVSKLVTVIWNSQHAVNTYKISRQQNLGTSIIWYKDYSSTRTSESSFIFGNEMNSIYVFD